jgi:hypothetical protein
MRWTIWARIVPIAVLGLSAVWWFLLRVARQVLDEIRFDHARELFRHEREWLEARFLSALAQINPLARLRWEDAQWHDEVVWARDRTTRRLLALVGVHFEPSSSNPFGDTSDEPPHLATALFEFRQGRWHAEGKWLDEIRPDEAFLRHQRFEPVILPRRG